MGSGHCKPHEIHTLHERYMNATRDTYATWTNALFVGATYSVQAWISRRRTFVFRARCESTFAADSPRFFASRSVWKDLYTIRGGIYIQINYLLAGGAVGAGELDVSPVTLYTKKSSTHKRCFIRHTSKIKWKWHPTFSEDSHFSSEIQWYKTPAMCFDFETCRAQPSVLPTRQPF